MVKKLDTCYGIRKGRGAPVVVHSWTEVVNKTNGFSGAEFKKFKSTAEANAYVNEVAVTPDAPSAAPPGTATMWFDGGSRGNPGLSGSGAVIFDDKNMELYSGYKFIGDHKTNNEAEYEGMILGLLAAVRLGAKRLIVKGDSMLVIQQMMGRWRVAAPKLLNLHRKASEAVKKNKLECTWQHVPRNLNARADLLANIAMDSKAGDEIFNPSTGVRFPHGNSIAAAPPPANGSPPGRAAPLSTTQCAPKPLPLVDVDPTGGTGASAPLLVDLSSPSSSRASPSVENASEDAALAAATAAYAAVAADARATIAGGGSSTALGATVMDIFGTSDVAGAGFEARAAQASADAGLVEGRRMADGIGEISKRRFMVHVASWRKTEGSAGAAAAILYEEGSWRRLNVLMRVARCRPQPTDVPQGRADSKLGKRRGRASVPSPPMTSDVLRALGEVLEEVELLGGGNVAAITNEPTLAALLQPASRGVSDEGDGHAARIGDEPFPSNPTTQHVLRRWRDLNGVLLDAADENELASAVMLARCCSNPPPVSTLAWNPAALAGASVDGSIDVSNAGAVQAVGKEKLWSSGGVSGRGLCSVGDGNTATLGGDGKEKLWSSGGVSDRGLGSAGGGNTIVGGDGKDRMWSSGGVSGRGLGSVGGGNTVLGGDGKDKMWSSGGVSGRGLGSAEGGSTTLGGDGRDRMWSSGGVSGRGLGSAEGGSTTLRGDGKDRMWSSGGVSGRGLGSVEGGSTMLGGVGRGLGSVGGGGTTLGGVGASPFSVFASNGKDPSGDCIADLWAGGVGDAVPVEDSEGMGRLKRSGERLEGGGESQLRRLDGTSDKADARSAGGGCSMPVSI